MAYYRRSITIDGKEIKSPRFERSSDADRWYQEKLRERQFGQHGMLVPSKNKVRLVDYFNDTWYPKRLENYPKATSDADFQRFEKYVSKEIGKSRVAQITQLQVRETLRKVVDVHDCSIQTRNRVRSLLSKIFNDSMNESPPLRSDNPALNISFTDARTGTKTPNHLKRQKDIIAFLKAAKKLGPRHHIYACIALMSGLRKSEMIPLRWNDFDEDECELLVDERYEQASDTIISGTKAGSDESRPVQISDELVKALKEYREKADFQDEHDFILCDEHGEIITPKKLHNLHHEIRTKANVSVTIHGLRHSYGRMFVANGGSMKALQAILGHSNSTVTDLYSELAGKEVKKYRNTVSFEVDDE